MAESDWVDAPESDWVDAPTQDEPQASWWDIAKKVPVDAVYGIQSTFGKGVDYLQSLGIAPENPFKDVPILGKAIEDSVHPGQDITQGAEEARKATKKSINLQPGSWKDITYDAVSSALPYAAEAALAPEALVGSIALDTFANEQDKLKQEGESPLRRTLGAIPKAELNAGLAMAPIGRLGEKTGILRKTGELAGLNTVIGGIQPWLEDALNGLMGTKQQSSEDLASQSARGVVSGLITAPIFAGASSVGGHGKGKKADINRLADEMAALDEGPPTPPPEPPTQTNVLGDTPRQFADFQKAEFQPAGFDKPQYVGPTSDQQPHVNQNETPLFEGVNQPQDITPSLAITGNPAQQRVLTARAQAAKGTLPPLTQDATALQQELKAPPPEPVKVQTLPAVKTPPVISGDRLASQDSFPEIAKTVQQATQSNPDNTVAMSKAYQMMLAARRHNDAQKMLPNERGDFQKEMKAALTPQAAQDPNATDPAVMGLPKPGEIQSVKAPVEENLPPIGTDIYGAEIAPATDAKHIHESTGKLPVERIKADTITIDPESFQFKESDSPNGTNAAERLSGKFDDGKAGNLTLFEPKDPKAFGLKDGQKYVVVNGHHRFELGSSQKIPEYNAHILRETDGYTPFEARLYGAEQNIADGKGTVKDHANFFRILRETSGKDAALARADQTGAKGRQGAAIGILAENNLYGKFVNRQLSAADTQAIAENAPNNKGLQDAGIEYANSDAKPDPLKIATYVRALGSGIGDTSKGMQEGDLFGSIDDTWKRQAAAEAQAVGTIRDQLTSQIAVLDNPSKNPTLAAEKGVSVLNPEAARAEAEQLKAQRAGLRNYQSDPNLLARVKELAAKILKGEVGSAPLIKDVVERVTRTKKELVDTKLSDKELDGLRAQLPAGEQLLGGKKLWIAKNLTLPMTLAERVPGFKKYHDLWKLREATKYATARTMNDALRPYFDLFDKTKVHQIFEAAHQKAVATGEKFHPTPEKLAKLGLDANEIQAAMALDSASNSALDILHHHLSQVAKRQNTPDSQDLQPRIDTLIENLRHTGYMPHGRYGDYFAIAKDHLGNVLEYSLHPKEKVAREAARSLTAKYKGSKISYGELNPVPNEAYADMPSDLQQGLSLIMGDTSKLADLPPLGFPGHLKAAKLTPGYDKDFAKSWAQYSVGLSNFAAQAETTHQFQKALAGDLAARNHRLYDLASGYFNQIKAKSSSNARLSTFMYHYMLGLNPKSALVNLTQVNLTNALLGLHTKVPELIVAKSIKPTWDYINNHDTFAKKNPELVAGLDAANTKGIVAHDAYQNMMGVATGGKPILRKASDISSYMFNTAEKANRVHAYISAYEVAKSKFKTIPERQAFAENLVRDSQFGYGAGDRPGIATGKAAPLFIFRMWSANYYRQIFNAIRAPMVEGKPIDRSLGTKLAYLGRVAIPQIALSGAIGLPVAGAIIKGMELGGFDPIRWLRKQFSAPVADAIEFGPISALTGYNLSGSVGLGQTVPTEGVTAFDLLGRFVAGAAGELVSRPVRAYQIATQDQNIPRAIETVMPEGVKNLFKATRLGTIGPTTPSGDKIPIKGKLTPSMIVGSALGFSPTPLAKAYDEQHSINVSNNAYREARSAMTTELANKIAAKGPEAIQAFLGMKFSDPGMQAVKNKLIGRVAPEYSHFLRTPKANRADVIDIMKQYHTE